MIVGQANVLGPEAVALHISTNDVACSEDGTDLFAVCGHCTGGQSSIGIDLGHRGRRAWDMVCLDCPFQFTSPYVVTIKFPCAVVCTRDEDMVTCDNWRVIAMLGDGGLPKDVALAAQVP